MEALRTALATLTALEERASEVVNAGEAISAAALVVLKEAIAVVQNIHDRLVALEGPAPEVKPEPLPVTITPGATVDAGLSHLEGVDVAVITDGGAPQEAPTA